MSTPPNMASHGPLEKEIDIDQLERAGTGGSVDSDKINDERINAFTPEEQKKIIRRIDRRLVLTLGFLYCVSLMDRTNLGIAIISVCLDDELEQCCKSNFPKSLSVLV